MIAKTNYKNAPIVEAAIDLHVQMGASFSIDQLSEFCKFEKVDFPIEETILADSVEIKNAKAADTTTPPHISSSREHVGFKILSQDRKRIISARKNGFSLSDLRPYSNWDLFHGEAMQRWKDYSRICKPIKVTRIAARYINRFDLPKSPIDLKDYFNIRPETPDEISIRGFFMQLQLPQNDIGAVAILNQTITPPAGRDVTSVILDIDIFGEQEWGVENESEVTSYLGKLRECKNNLFEMAITDKTRELIS